MLKSILFAVSVLLVFAHMGLCSDSATQAVRMRVREACVVDTEQDHIFLNAAEQSHTGEFELRAPEAVVYSRFSVLASAGDAHIVTAAFDMAGAQPAGCSVVLEATGLASEQGLVIGERITLSPDAKRILSTVGSCATGTGAAQGVKLEYRLGSGDEGVYAPESGFSRVLMTITDAS
ncbi:MAG: hypothetical protein ABIJ00_12445 [Candidatus Eisenbacteria bacterium]